MPTAEDMDKNDNVVLFSPRFRSVAAMAGWDEEALLIASLVVEDTPDRQLKQRKRSDLQSFKTPPTNSRRKRRAQRKSPSSKPPVVTLDLDDDELNSKKEDEKVNKDSKAGKESESKDADNEENCKTAASIPCIDKLRDELSCAICLEICYEPSTTPCGHSFCKKCLRSAADRCGKKCPKCRQLISNGRHSTVNTVLWNTIQLLFPEDVETRRAAAAAAAASSSPGSHERVSPPSRNRRNRVVASLNSPDSETRDRRNRNNLHHQVARRQRPGQDEDAALALRLQRQEFMEVFSNGSRGNRGSRISGNTSSRTDNSSAVARANLRAMASRAMNIRIRGHTTTHHSNRNL